MGISYNGRTYDEGKKIGWRDGVRAVWCIVKYSGPGDRAQRLVGRAPAPPGGPAAPHDTDPTTAPRGDGATGLPANGAHAGSHRAV